MRTLLDHERCCLFAGDSGELELPENSVDSLVFDPPAAISFMGAKWDDDRGGFDGWTQWLAKTLQPARRALKPGGFGLCWALPRTSHWTARAIEIAGFEIRDVHHDAIAADDLAAAFIDSLDEAQRAAFARALESLAAPIYYQVFGQGFPKSLTSKSAAIPEWAGTALKPAVEHWILFRKPLNSTVAAVYAEHGTGVLNIGGCRIGDASVDLAAVQRCQAQQSGDTMTLNIPGHVQPTYNAAGRWPAHLSLTHASGCELVGLTVEVKATYANAGDTDRTGNGTNFAMGVQRADGRAEVTREVYRCAPGCPVAELDAQSGTLASGKRKAGVRQGRRAGQTYGDQKGDGGPEVLANAGGASRFFYTPKASRSEKDAGLAHLRPTTGGEATGRVDDSVGTQNPRAGAGRTGGARNCHPTSKAVALMDWLIRLVTPPGGTVLDPFSGSGTTGVAAIKAGFNFVGCDEGGPGGKYLPILVGRVRHALGLPPDLSLSGEPLPGASDCRYDPEGTDDELEALED